MFKENNHFVNAGLGTTKVTIFVAVILKTRKGVCFRLQREMPKGGRSQNVQG